MDVVTVTAVMLRGCLGLYMDQGRRLDAFLVIGKASVTVDFIYTCICCSERSLHVVV